MRTYTHTYIHARTRTIYTHIRLQCTTFFLISIFCLCFITCWTGIFRLTNISFAPAVRENNGTVARRTHARDSLAVNNRLRRIPSVYNNCFVITFFFFIIIIRNAQECHGFLRRYRRWCHRLRPLFVLSLETPSSLICLSSFVWSTTVV